MVIQGAIDALDPLEAAGRLEDVPVFFLAGAWDSIAPPDQIEVLAARLTGPCERLVVPRRNHFTLMTSGRGTGAVAQWFGQRLTR